MKKFNWPILFVAIGAYCMGFLTNHYLQKFKTMPVSEARVLENDQGTVTSQPLANDESAERTPVSMEEFDDKKIFETLKRFHSNNSFNSVRGAGTLGLITRRIDGKNVYYDIPYQDKKFHKLEIEVKEDFLVVKENLTDPNDPMIQTKSQREIVVPNGYDVAKSEIIEGQTSLTIRVPNKREKK